MQGEGGQQRTCKERLREPRCRVDLFVRLCFNPLRSLPFNPLPPSSVVSCALTQLPTVESGGRASEGAEHCCLVGRPQNNTGPSAAASRRRRRRRRRRRKEVYALKRSRDIYFPLASKPPPPPLRRESGSCDGDSRGDPRQAGRCLCLLVVLSAAEPVHVFLPLLLPRTFSRGRPLFASSEDI